MANIDVKFNVQIGDSIERINSLTRSLNAQRDKINETRDKIRSYTSELNQLRLDRVGYMMDNNTAALKRNSQQMLEARRNIMAEKNSMDLLRSSLEKTISSRNKESQALREARQEKQKAIEQNKQLGRSLFGNIPILNQLWSRFSYIFGVYGMIRLIGNVVKTIRDFELGMAKVQAITGSTKEELKGLSDAAILLSQQGIFSAKEVTGLYLELAKLGFSIKEIESASEGIVNLATATGESLANSAQLTASVIRAFGMDASETTKIVNVMAKSFTTSALNLERFRESIKYVAPVADKLGFTFANVSAMMAVLADAQIYGSLAGTGLRNIMAALADSTSDFQKALGGNIITFEDFISGLKSAQERGIDLDEIFRVIEKRASTATAVLIENAEKIMVLSEAYENASGAVDEMANVQMDTLSYQLKRLNNNWQAWILSLQRDGGVLQDTVSVLSDLLRLMSLLNKDLRAASGKQMSTSGIRDAWQSRVDSAINSKDLDRIKKLDDEFIAELDRLNEAIGKDTQKFKLAIGEKKEFYRTFVESQIADQNVLLDEYKRFQALRARLNKEEVDDIKSLDDAYHAMMVQKIKYYHADFEELRLLENELNRYNLLKIDMIEGERERNLRLEEERYRHLGVMRDIMRDEENYWAELLDRTERSIREFGIKIIEASERRMEEMRKREQELRKALSKYFELEDEEYVDDIPFDTAAIVSGTEGTQWISDLLSGMRLFGDAFSDVADAVVDAIDRIVDRYDTMISETQRALDAELRLMEMGYANNVDAKRAELEQMKALRAEALEDQRKAVRQQQLLESISQGVNIASAASSLIKNAFGATGPLALLVAPGLLAALFALWRQARVTAIQSAYPEFGEGGWIDGKPHSRGGVHIVGEGDEFVVQKKYAVQNAGLLEAINDGKFSVNNLNHLAIAASVNLDESRHLRNMDKTLSRMSRGGVMVQFGNGYVVEKSGIRTRKIHAV